MLDRVAEGRDPIKPRELAAVWRGDLAGAGAALDLDAEAVNEPGPHPVWGGRPDPLQLAAERGRAEIARLLLARGAPLESVAPRGGTALDSALGRGLRGRSVAALLIERGARPDPCQLAALGWTERLLRRIDADPAALSFRGRIGLNEVVGTPLHGGGRRARNHAPHVGAGGCPDRGGQPGAPGAGGIPERGDARGPLREAGATGPRAGAPAPAPAPGPAWRPRTGRRRPRPRAAGPWP